MLLYSTVPLAVHSDSICAALVSTELHKLTTNLETNEPTKAFRVPVPVLVSIRHCSHTTGFFLLNHWLG